MSAVKGAPPPGWRPTVKGKTGGLAKGDIFSNAAQGGSVQLPDGAAAVPGSRFNSNGGLGSSRGTAHEAEPQLSDLFGDRPDYGMYRAVAPTVGSSGAGRQPPPVVAGQGPQRPAPDTRRRPNHDRFFDDSDDDKAAQAGGQQKAVPQKSAARDFGKLFEGLDDGSEAKAKAKAAPASHRPAAKPQLPDYYPTSTSGPDYRSLFERLQQGGGQVAEADDEVVDLPRPVASKRPGQQEDQVLFKQTHVIEEPQPGQNLQPQLPRATMGNGKSIRRGQKLILDLDSFLVDCAVDWGRERAIKGFNLCGKADEGVSKWSETMQSRGVLTMEDFRNHGVELDLSDTNVISSGYSHLEKFSGALKMDLCITTLRLSRAQLGNAGCGWLAGGMMKNKTLKELILSENEITNEGIDGLAAVLDTNTTLTLLDLSSNQLTSPGAALLADGLKRNRKLRELNLSFNDVSDEGAECLAQAIDPAGTSNSVLRTLKLEGNPVGKQGCHCLLNSFNKRGSFVETLYLPDDVYSTKKEPETKRKEPEKFVVVCSENGVDIRAAGRKKEQVTWLQEAEDIEITFKEGWLQKRDMKSANVEFDEQRLRIEIKGVQLMDAQLHGRIRPRDCTWTLGDGILQVVLAKADKTQWPSLASSV